MLKINNFAYPDRRNSAKTLEIQGVNPGTALKVDKFPGCSG